MNRFFARLRALVQRGRAEHEMDREIAAHLTLIEDDFRRQGMDAREAHLAALRAYGGVEQAKEMHRDERSFVWVEQTAQDLRHAVRSLRKSPAFLTVALLSLTFGIGVNTSIFTLVNGILLKRIAVAHPEQIVQVTAHFSDVDGTGFSYPVYRELSRQKMFSGLIAFQPTMKQVDFGGGPQKTEMAVVTGSYFAFFGARPALGKLIDDEDDRMPGANTGCVISYRTWQTRFAGDPGVIGRTIRIEGEPHQIQGVASPDFVGPDLQRRDEVWQPSANYSWRDMPTRVWLQVLGRIAPGMSRAEASARLEGASVAIEGALPRNRANAGAVYRLVDGSKGADSWRTSLHDPLIILMGAVTLVLLVACANLANLVLARTGERRQEFAIKLSLGISRGRLLRQLLVETLLITFTGGVLAWLLAPLLSNYLLSVFNTGSAFRRLHVSADLSVLFYTSAGCVVTALLAGLYPAVQAARTDFATRLAAASNTRRSFLRRSLILIQVTLAVVLLFGASLFTHSLRKLKTLDLGFDPHRAVSVVVTSAAPARMLKADYPPAAFAEVLARVRQLPSVESAAFANPGVLSSMSMSQSLKTRDRAGQERETGVNYSFVGPGYFGTLHMPMVKGRDFTTGDRVGAAPVAIVNQKAASLLWPGEDPVGKHIAGWTAKDVEVVGVVGNSKYQHLREAAKPIVYEPFDQTKSVGGTLEIRARGDFQEVERDVRRIVKAAAPGYQSGATTSIELLRDGLISQDRVLAFLSSLFGALGTLLALVGIYGLISYSVTRRTREVGIRLSIGAQRRDVLWLFLRESVALVGGGILIGLPLALGLARFIAKMLFNVSPMEPVDVGITLSCLALGGALAALVPGRRATRIDPMRALRHD